MSSLFFFHSLSPFYVRPQSTVLLLLSQELSRFHAHEVHPVQRWQVRAGTEQPALWHHPRAHPLLHHTQTPDQRRWAPVLAFPSAGTDTLTALERPFSDQTLWTWMFDWIYPVEWKRSPLFWLEDFWWLSTWGAYALTYHCCCTRAKLKHLGDRFTWNAIPELEAPFLSHPNEADLRTKKTFISLHFFPVDVCRAPKRRTCVFWMYWRPAGDWD